MNTLVVFNIDALMLHWQICRVIAELPYTTPGTRARCLQLADNYKTWADLVRSADNGQSKPVIVGNISSADIPSFDDIEHMVDWSQYDKKPCIWKLQLLDLGMNPIAGKEIHATTLWNFYQAIEKRYPKAPRGIIGWAAYAQKGDAAAFKRSNDNVVYQISLE